jgi:hypothetical protein
MEEKIRIELSLEELNEIYYMFGKTWLDKPYKLAKYNVIEKVMDQVRDLIETKNK